MADFTNNLALVNGLAERSTGFVWRYIDESGNSTATRPYADPRIAINLSVWESVEALERFVYLTLHKRFYERRSEWFEHFDGPYFVVWRVPAGHRQSVEEAVARLNHLKQHGTSDYAFGKRRPPQLGRRLVVRPEDRWLKTKMPSCKTERAMPASWHGATVLIDEFLPMQSG